MRHVLRASIRGSDWGSVTWALFYGFWFVLLFSLSSLPSCVAQLGDASNLLAAGRLGSASAFFRCALPSLSGSPASPKVAARSDRDSLLDGQRVSNRASPFWRVPL